jgi:uncharacterized protein (TIGR02679 family)
VTGGASNIDHYRGPEYQRLFAAARRSLENSGGDLTAGVSVPDPDEAERRAIIGITGKFRSASSARISVRLADLDTAVRTGTGLGLADLLATIGGPLRDRPAERLAAATARAAALHTAESSGLHDSCDWYRTWLEGVVGDGTLTKLLNQGETAQLTRAIRVLEHLTDPTVGTAPVMLPALAVNMTGDTKALGHGTILSNLILRALAIRTGKDRPANPEDRRELWDAFNVIVDDLASRVLVLNLSADGAGLGEWLTGATRYGTPFHVTLHQLVTHPIRLHHPLVYVCENPAILRRAAGDLGPASAPLICTEGRPSTAFHRLARAITEGGGELRYHGDFDWPGIAIATQVMQRHNARPWRMSTTDYLAGIDLEDDHMALDGKAQSTSWDEGLAEAMAAAGRAVYEESVADQLIADLDGYRDCGDPQSAQAHDSR